MPAKATSFAAATALCASLCFAFASPALAEAPRYSIDIQGFVPVVCRAKVDAGTVRAVPGKAELGQLHEFCNSASGYRVYADYSPELANARLVIDGRTVSLSGGGSTLISSSDAAAIATHDLALQLPQGVKGGSISFRIVAA
jgi:hypothetical protein